MVIEEFMNVILPIIGIGFVLFGIYSLYNSIIITKYHKRLRKIIPDLPYEYLKEFKQDYYHIIDNPSDSKRLKKLTCKYERIVNGTP